MPGPDPAMTLSFRCSRRWEELRRIAGVGDVRFCDDCRAAVHCVRTHAEFAARAAAGQCVALDVDEGGGKIGQPAPPYLPFGPAKPP
jgi:hypothetical protein